MAGSENGVESEGDFGQGLDLRVWDWAVNVRGGGGYRDNVLYSSYRPDGSGFVSTGVDLFVMRLPADGTEFSFLFSGEDRRYFEALDAEKEQTYFAYAVMKKPVGGGWTVGMAAQYFYLDQVFDASTTELDVGVVFAQGHTFTGRPLLTRALGTNFWLDVEIPVTRQLFEEQLDDYWEYGPRVAVRHGFGRGSEWYLSGEFLSRPYDTRTQVSDVGEPMDQTNLEFGIQRFEVGWRQAWDRRRVWRTVTRVGLELNRDNGSGYFDYDRFYCSEQVYFQNGLWGLKAEVRLSSYEYAVQTGDPPDPDARTKTLVSTSVRGERQLVKRLKLFAEYEYEQSLANQAGDEYRVNTVSAGLDYEF